MSSQDGALAAGKELQFYMLCTVLFLYCSTEPVVQIIPLVCHVGFALWSDMQGKPF